MKSIQIFALMMGLFTISSWSNGALASPIYPSILRDSEMMVTEDDNSCTPECTLCHTDNSGGSGTANKPFSITLIKLGLRGSNEESLEQALLALKTMNPEADSDEDGRTDLDELRTPAEFPEDPQNGGAWDPNVVGPGSLCADLPRYGCGAQFSGDIGKEYGVWLLSLLLVAALFARRFFRLS